MPIGVSLANRSAVWLFEEVNNGLLSAEWYSNSVEHLKWSCWAAPLNNFRKKIHLTIFHLRGSEFDSDLKHSEKEYIYLRSGSVKKQSAINKKIEFSVFKLV